MPIDYDRQERVEKVVEGRGWRQVTIYPNGGRHYEDLLPADNRWPETTDEFVSVSHMLRSVWPTDWTGPTKWNQARATIAEWDTLSKMPTDERLEWMVQASDVTLQEAADRGSSIHRMVERSLGGQDMDWSDISRNQAMPWVAAVRNFFTNENPTAVHGERVVFSRDTGTAGTVDFVGTIDSLDGVGVIDWKTRTGDRHDRRGKEAAQIGAYCDALLNGYFMTDRGRRRSLDKLDWAAVVTFGADGTYQIHLLDVAACITAWRYACELKEHLLVSTLFDGRARTGPEPDVNGWALARLENVTGENREKLAAEWRKRGLGSASKGDLTVEDWPLVDWLLFKFEDFPEREPEPSEEKADPDDVKLMRSQFDALPTDLRAQARSWATGLPSLDQAMTVADLDDWVTVLAMAGAAHADRLDETGNLAKLLGEVDLPTDLVIGDPDLWTEQDLERLSLVWDAAQQGLLDDRDCLNHLPKREVTAEAKRQAELLGLPRPSKFSDVQSDTYLWAATTVALKETMTDQTKEED